MICSVNSPAGSMPLHSVIPVVLRASSVQIKIKLLTHGPFGGRQRRVAAATVALHDAIVRAGAFLIRTEDHGDHGGRGFARPTADIGGWRLGAGERHAAKTPDRAPSLLLLNLAAIPCPSPFLGVVQQEGN